MPIMKKRGPVYVLFAFKIFLLPVPTRPGTRTFLQVPNLSRPEVKNTTRQALNTVMAKIQDEKIQKEAVVLDNKVVQWQLFVCKGAAADSFTGLQIYPQARSRHQNTAQIHQLENNTQIHAYQNTARIHQLENNSQI